MKYGYTRSYADNKIHKYTALFSGFPHWIESGLGRFPGITFYIEGHIPMEDMKAIKKNIVEKGLWKEYTEKESTDAVIGIYNEMLTHLNKKA